MLRKTTIVCKKSDHHQGGGQVGEGAMRRLKDSIDAYTSSRVVHLKAVMTMCCMAGIGVNRWMVKAVLCARFRGAKTPAKTWLQSRQPLVKL